MFMFPLKNLARKGLSCKTDYVDFQFWTHDGNDIKDFLQDSEYPEFLQLIFFSYESLIN